MERDLECARAVRNGDLLALDADALERVDSRFDQALNDEAVEATGDDGKAAFRGGEIAFDDLHCRIP